MTKKHQERQKYLIEMDKLTNPAYSLDYGYLRIFDMKTGKTAKHFLPFESFEERDARLNMVYDYGIELYNTNTNELVYILKGVPGINYNLQYTLYEELDNRRIPTKGDFFVLTTNAIFDCDRQIYFNPEKDKYPRSVSLGQMNYECANIILQINGVQTEVAVKVINDNAFALYDLYDTRIFYREFPFDGAKYYLANCEVIDNTKIRIDYVEASYNAAYTDRDIGTQIFDINMDCIQETKEMTDPRTEYVLNTQGQIDISKVDYDNLMPHEMSLLDIKTRYGDKLYLLKENIMNTYELNTFDTYTEVRNAYEFKEYSMSGDDFVVFLIFKDGILNTCEYVLRSNFD